MYSEDAIDEEPAPGPAPDDSLRPDGTTKGEGWMGRIPMDDGRHMTEMSIGVDFDGKENLIPAIVPTLSEEEVKHLSSGGQVNDSITQKAVEHARQLIKEGKSPFKEGAIPNDRDYRKISNPSSKWKTADPSRAIPAQNFDRLVRETLSSIARKAGQPDLMSEDAVEILKMTAGNETRNAGYMKEPGTSTQRGVFQITDPTLGDLIRKIQKSPALSKAIAEVTGVSDITPQDVESNVPLGIILARLKYTSDMNPLPSKADPQAMASTYKRVYNTYHPKAKADVQTVLRVYHQLYGR